MTKKILIIDDNEQNLNLFSIVLKSAGYETLEANNGVEGIRLAIEEKPHLILVDIQMPVMDGFEAIQVLKSELSTKDIPSIALTAYSLKEGRDGFFKHGFIDYIEKPTKLQKFIRTIEGHLNNKA
ncbi:MAG: response regulator [Nitrospirae bacterium]|jgi:two-component system, cell cycle response regulator DivK|nr:response regulator [Nitrospirota bacterium]